MYEIYFILNKRIHESLFYSIRNFSWNRFFFNAEIDSEIDAETVPFFPGRIVMKTSRRRTTFRRVESDFRKFDT